MATFVAFVLAGMIPLLPVLAALRQPVDKTFPISALFAGIAFFLVGYIRGRVVEHRAWLAAGLAYGIGGWLRQLAIG